MSNSSSTKRKFYPKGVEFALASSSDSSDEGSSSPATTSSRRGPPRSKPLSSGAASSSSSSSSFRAPPPPDPSPSSRKSSRSRTTRYFTTAEGHTVLKANNYTVVGDSYKYNEDETDYSERRNEKRASASSSAARDGSPQKRRVMTAQQKELQSHNNSLRADLDASLALRRSYFVRHLPTLLPFLPSSISSPLALSPPTPDVVFPEIFFQPDGIQGDMRDYQLAGLNFLARMHARGLPCILGDEMGLGKTLQTIAFLQYLKEDLKQGGPSLIVCPLSVVNSWMDEIKRWAPDFKALRLHASDPIERDKQIRIMKDSWSSFDVIVTTYDMVKVDNLTSFFSRYYFRYVVLDEGHVIKNVETQLSVAIRKVHSHGRLILTGTPLQNNLRELWALLNYLYPEVFTDSQPFDDAFDLSLQKVDRKTLDLAHSMLKLFMIRRLKSEVEKLMPKKLEIQISCPLSKVQQTWYKGLLLKDVAMLCNLEKQALESSSSSSSSSAAAATATTAFVAAAPADPPSQANYTQLSNLIMQLRKCCNHPFCFDGAEDIETTTVTDIIAASGKMAVLDKLLIHLHKNGHRVCLFSQFTSMLDIIDDYCALRGWRYVRLDGSTSRVRRMMDVETFNAPHSNEFLFLMSTRAGGMGLNLQSADTVILYDSDWNPQPDIQAMARVHRIGQMKTVHVYRMVSAGTVEVRMIERAQKKLFLDRMVNGGEGRGLNGEVREGDEDDDIARLTTKDLLDTLKFGSDAVFGKLTNDLPSDAEIVAITDRTKNLETLDDADDGGSAGGDGVIKSAKKTVGNFEATAAYFNTSTFGGVDFVAIRERLQEEKRREKATLASGKRVGNKRITMIPGLGSGYGSKFVPVLAANNYDLEDGEASVFDRELKNRRKDQKALSAVPEKRKVDIVEGHQSMCQACGFSAGQHETLLKCGKCPVAMHYECALAGLPAGSQISTRWNCTHHRCISCRRTMSAAGGLLFRCQCCAMAFCDECMPKDSDRLGRCERFENFDFVDPRGFYIHCSLSCREVARRDCGWKEPGLAPKPKTPEPIDVSFAFSNLVEETGEEIADVDIGEDVAAEGTGGGGRGGEGLVDPSLASFVRRVSPLTSAPHFQLPAAEARSKQPAEIRRITDHMQTGPGLL